MSCQQQSTISSQLGKLSDKLIGERPFIPHTQQENNSLQHDFESKLHLSSKEREQFEQIFQHEQNEANTIAHDEYIRHESWIDEYNDGTMFNNGLISAEEERVLERAWMNENDLFEQAWNQAQMHRTIRKSGQDELKDAARDFMERVQPERNEKMRQSKFMNWMRRISQEELVLEGETLVEKTFNKS